VKVNYFLLASAEQLTTVSAINFTTLNGSTSDMLCTCYGSTVDLP